MILLSTAAASGDSSHIEVPLCVPVIPFGRVINCGTMMHGPSLRGGVLKELMIGTTSWDIMLCYSYTEL